MTPRTPSYRLHRPTGQAVATLSGRDFYPGEHGSESSKAEYDRRIAEWLGAGRRLPNLGSESSGLTANRVSAH